MNVQMLIQYIKQKPEMFIGSCEMDYLHQFVSGFLFSNITNNQADYVDYAFKKRFHKWVKEQIESAKGVKYTEQRNYVYYISQSYEKDERIGVFFALCEEFFKMIEREVQEMSMSDISSEL